MKKIYFIVFFIFFGGLIFLSSCAKRGVITGGPKDTIPPFIINSNPKNFATEFSGKEIKIHFNELIKVKDINKQLIISPPMKKQPIIVPQSSASKYISIKILDTLQPNTTYSFNFGQSITDNNEGNSYSQYKYVFSTGSYIDSLSIVGKIKDAYEQKPDNFVSIQLYDASTFTDSTIFKYSPLYVTNTLDSAKHFALENLKKGSYYMIALKDKNNDTKFNPKIDKIGFLKDKITLPNDTVFELELFKEKQLFKVEKPIQQSNNKYFMGFSGDPIDAKITAQSNGNQIPIKMTAFPVSGKDSVQLFVPMLKADSLTFTIKKDNYQKSFTTKIKALKTIDSLAIEAKQKSILHFREAFTLKTKTPLEKIDVGKIILRAKDSSIVNFTIDYKEFEQDVIFNFDKKEEQKYTLKILPGAFIDFYNSSNDSLSFSFYTKSLSDYGNLKVTLKKVNRFPLILEVLNSKGIVVANTISNGEKIIPFDLLEPAIYSLRIIYDDNKNGVWDTGNYLEKRQAEEIIYLPKLIDVRTNWDVEQDFILD